MPRYEYKVVPAPKKASRVKGVKGTEARFAVALAEIMNDYGADGWEYQRTDTLPCEERAGLMSAKTTSFQNMLVFRRQLGGAAQASPGIASIPDRAPSADAITSIHMAAPAAEPVAAEPPRRMTEPAPRPIAVPEPLPEPEQAAPQPEREEVAMMPSFRSAAHKQAEPAFSSRIQEGRTPRLGAAHRTDSSGKPTLVTR